MGTKCLPFLVVLVEFLQIESSEVIPMIVGGAVGLERQLGLLLVKEHLEEHILIVDIRTIENELQIRGHGENIGTPPTLAINVLPVIDVFIVAIDAQQTGQWQQHCLVAET